MRDSYLNAEMHSLINRTQVRWACANVCRSPENEQVANFIFLVARCCERALYHGLRTNELLVSMVEECAHVKLREGGYTFAKKVHIKYEIEAYLAAVKTLFEIPGGTSKNSSPMKRLLEGLPGATTRFSKVFGAYPDIFQHGGVANKIRNASTHALKELNDDGNYALIRMDQGRKRVVCLHVYKVAGQPDIDLVEIFEEVDQSLRSFLYKLFRALVEQIRETNGVVKENMFMPNESQHCHVTLRYANGDSHATVWEHAMPGGATIRQLC